MSVLLLALSPSTALACGGFFCNTDPIEQSKEGIVFAQTGRGTWETHVQIGYQGDADTFSWIVPVPGVPSLEVGTDEMFRQLTWRTAPSFQVDNAPHECTDNYWDYWGYDVMMDADGIASPSAGAESSVEVLEESTVGTYTATVVTARRADDLVAWFDCNGYRVADGSVSRIQHYLDEGHNFLALKLVSGADVGTLTPIVMETDTMCPFVPLVMTAVAAEPNMPVNVWVMGEGRAVSTNWAHVTVNPARINWSNYAQSWYWWWGASDSSYEALVSHAVDEAGGQAFVTDYAGSPDVMQNAIYMDGRFDLDTLRSRTQPWDFINELLRQGFPRNAVMQGILRTHIPMPQELVDQGIDERSFYNNLSYYSEHVGPFDPIATVTDVELLVIDPLANAQALFDDPRPDRMLTRLTTTVSPWEMVSDPQFTVIPAGSENALGKVNQTRTATAHYLGDTPDEQCADLARYVDSGVGVHQVIQGADDPLVPTMAPDCNELPAALQIQYFDEDGNVVMQQDNRASLSALARDGYCKWRGTAPVSTDPPATWVGDGPLRKPELRAPEVCAAFDGTTETITPGTSNPGNGGFPAVNDGSALATAEPAGGSCGCSTPGGSGSLAGLLVVTLLGLRRRRGAVVAAALTLSACSTPQDTAPIEGRIAAHELVTASADTDAYASTLDALGVGAAISVGPEVRVVNVARRVAMSHNPADAIIGSDAFAARLAQCTEDGEPMLLIADLRPARTQLALERTLREQPDAVVVLARYGGLFTQLDRLEQLLRANPNLYVDISAGNDPSPYLGLIRRHPQRVRQFLLTWHNRLLWGTGARVDGDLERVRQRIQVDLDLYTSDRVEWKGEVQAGFELPAEITDAMLGDNARRVYDLD